LIHVVAGAVTDAAGRVLIAQRPLGKHLAGWWEFPGAKVKVGESAVEALARELHEKLAGLAELLPADRPVARALSCWSKQRPRILRYSTAYLTE